MRKTVIWCAVLLACLASAGRAPAVIGAYDDVPAATLLYPYFEVDLNDTNGRTTILEVSNTSATAVLSHVVVYSDLGVPVLAFNVYLTGYDVQTINMRDVLDGVLPQTASAGQDPRDTISPKGQLSQDINFASCTGLLPPIDLKSLVSLGVDYPAHMKDSLTGKASALYNNLCSGVPYGDNVARGYVTMDTVNNCTLRTQASPGYFGSGGTGDATNQNVLSGSMLLVNKTAGLAAAIRAAHIEAAPGTGNSDGYGNDPRTTTPGNYTYYGRYVAWQATDNREPLPKVWGVPYSDARTQAVVWRDVKVAGQGTSYYGAVPCPAVAGNPGWLPLGQEQMAAFDMQEKVSTLTGIPFGYATQRVSFGTAAGVGAQVQAANGWAFLNLNTAPVGSTGPTVDLLAAQSFVALLGFPEGLGGPDTLSLGAMAFALEAVNDGNIHTILPVP